VSRPLPPFGKYFQPVPKTGIRVAIGQGAWDFAKNHHAPIMVLPDADIPKDYRWPSDGKPALIYERGTYNDARLDSLAQALLQAGASSVVAIREALLKDNDPRVFYDAEVLDVAG
jgi:hypothetical protein